MRKSFFLTLSVIYMLIMTFCAYTPIVSQYINDENNYVEIEATVFATKYNEDGYSYLYIRLTEFSRYYGFTGIMPENFDQTVLENTTVTIKIVPESAAILKERGFFDTVQFGDAITVKTTCWIYDGIKRHYLGAVWTDDTEYLTFEEGLHSVSTATKKLNKIEIKEIFNPSHHEDHVEN